MCKSCYFHTVSVQGGGLVGCTVHSNGFTLPDLNFRQLVSNPQPKVACGLPGCIMWPMATFVNYVYPIKISQIFRQLGILVTVIFPCTVHEPAHNNGCGS
jgi:hypothetical protein